VPEQTPITAHSELQHASLQQHSTTRRYTHYETVKQQQVREDELLRPQNTQKAREKTQKTIHYFLINHEYESLDLDQCWDFLISSKWKSSSQQ
jgi:hypothetical protein